MVLYKRKSISLPEPNPLPRNLNIKIWYIKETGEWFTEYLHFLERMEFYNRRLFTCEITGTSCLTFFEALNSEESQFQYVEKMFPIKLREPVAKFIHFNDIRRLDFLVEQVYTKFKSDFFPGEIVYLRKSKLGSKIAVDEVGQTNTLFQKPYIIKEKAQFNAVVDKNSNEELSPAHVKYMLQDAHGSASCVADESEIYRERSSFTKHLIKCFCKITLKRASSKMGAPWCVRDEYLPIYSISTDWPENMLKYKEDYQSTQQITEEKEFEGLKHELGSNSAVSPDRKKMKMDNHSLDASPDVELTDKAYGLSQPVTKIMDDLKLPFLAPRTSNFNEKLLSYSENYVAGPSHQVGLGAQCIEKFLQCYQFFMTFRETLHITEFTWDDFVNSLRFTDPRQSLKEYVTITLSDGSDELIKRHNFYNDAIYAFIESFNSSKMKISVEVNEELDENFLDDVKSTGTSLIVECFCALLRLFIDSDGNWTTTVTEEWYFDTDKETEHADTDSKNTNNSLDTDALLEKCLNYRKVEWTERLMKREFKNGVWIIILLGVLQDCIHIPMYTQIIRDFIEKLVPSVKSPNNIPLNKLLWRRFCNEISLDSKVSIMWILVELLANYSSIIKSAMDDAMELCSHIRSERFKLTRDIKNMNTRIGELKDAISSKESEDNVDSSELKSLKVDLSSSEMELSRISKIKLFLDRKLMEVDARRLKPIGFDRYGNKLYLLKYHGVPKDDSLSTVPEFEGRLWIQGPSTEAASLYLKISEQEVASWRSIAKLKGKVTATREVFHVYRDSKGSYFYEDEHGSVLLVNAEGEYNSIIELSPIQKKIIDETPERLLLSSNDWSFVNDIQQVDELCRWMDSWGKREHDTLKQLQNFRDTIEKSFSFSKTSNDHFDTEEAGNLMAEIASMKPTDDEIFVDKLPVDNDESAVDEELDSIAHQIMILDDSSKTRRVLEKISQLEAHRDELLLKKNSLDQGTSELASEKLSRPKRKALRASRDRKIEVLKDNFDKLLNLQREHDRNAINGWSNSAAISLWSSELSQLNGGSVGMKDPENVTAAVTFSNILEQATILGTNNAY